MYLFIFALASPMGALLTYLGVTINSMISAGQVSVSFTITPPFEMMFLTEYQTF